MYGLTKNDGEVVLRFKNNKELEQLAKECCYDDGEHMLKDFNIEKEELENKWFMFVVGNPLGTRVFEYEDKDVEEIPPDKLKDYVG